MSRTCSESSSLARQLASREGALRLDNGVLVALEGSQDLITLDYLPPDLHQTDRALEVDFSCPGLEKIRRAAVRVSPMWKPAKTYPAKCKTCQEVHEVRDGGNCPTHLYQFRAKDRVFHEIVGDGSSDRAWKTDSKTGRIRDWLRDSFVRYCNNSPLARHQSPNKVRFGILACQFNILPPSPSKAKTYPSSGKLRPVRERPTRAKASQAGKLFGSSSRSAASLFGEPGTGRGRLFGDDLSAAWITRLQNEMASRPAAVQVDAPPQPPPETDQAQSWGGLFFAFGGVSRISFRFTFSLFHDSIRRWTGL